MRHRASRLLVLALAVACIDRDRGAASGVVTRVEAIGGVPHVIAEGDPPTWRLERERSIGRLGSVGARPTPDEFGRVGWLALDRDGAVYVADPSAREIRVFDTSGVYLRTIGRRGSGPGEFESLSAIAFIGDTLVAVDGGNSRLTLLDRSGAYLGQWLYGRFGGGADWLHDLGGDTIAVLSFSRAGGRLSRVYVMHTSAGPRDTVPMLPSPARVAPRGMDCEGRGGAIHVYSTPLAPRHIAIPARGGGFITAWSDAYHIAFLDAAGDTIRVVERREESFRVPDTMRARVDAEYERFKETPGLGRCTPASLPEYRILPPIRHVMVDDEGRLWIEVLDGNGRRWDIFSSDGGLLGSARSGARLDGVRPIVRKGRLAVAEEAPEGHHRVVVYRLAKGS